MTPVEDVLLEAIAQRGDRYVFGTEASPLDPNPTQFDCSELVEWACARAGVTPRMPDGAYYQWRHCLDHQLGISVDRALHTRGALLFHGDGTGVGRDAVTHVAWSLGDGTTVEARGAKWGVGTWASPGRFQMAGLMPGVDYSPKPPPFPIQPPPMKGDLMRDERIILIPTPDADGRQIVNSDKDGHGLGRYSLTSSVEVCASHDGHITDLQAQPFGYIDALCLSVSELNGAPAPAGHEARIVIEHR